MLRRQTTGSVVCPACGKLVGVKDETCWSCGRRNPGMWGFAPFFRALGQDLGFVQLVLWGCSVLYLVTLVMTFRRHGGLGSGGILGFLAPDGEILFLFGASGAEPVFRLGRWWTVLSAAWLHGSALHIVFNMLWIRDLGHLTAEAYGAGRMVVLYTVAAITGFAASTLAGEYLWFLPGFLRGAQLTVGASAPLFGLLAALIYYGRRAGSSALGQQAKFYAVVLALFGFLWPGVDNWAHLGGFLGGWFAARVLDPLKPERLDHLLLALLCLGLSLASVVFSVILGLKFLG